VAKRACLILALTGCGGAQSALRPAGRDAERIAELFWWMAGGALLVWAVVIGAALYAILRPLQRFDKLKTAIVIIGGGTAFPIVVLAILLTGGLSMMPSLLDLGEERGLQIRVEGEQWWWRVHYRMPDGAEFELANELWLPVDRRVPIALEARDVIHSFWVPSLGGKIDMIPGRTNWIALEPTEVGVYRGACAEYCGLSHAKMLLRVVVVDEEQFESWAARERSPAEQPTGELARRGAELFSSLGCGACHAVRGTEADGAIGPDLTHVGGRRTVGAGILDNQAVHFRHWLSDLDLLKPGVRMPSFDMLERDDLRALAAFLDGLE
jgi:cytochrome c oxidase subunit 2